MLVMLEAVTVRGQIEPLAATTLPELKPGPGPALETSGLHQRIPLGSFDSLSNSRRGVFEFRKVRADYVIPAGLQSDWVTVVP